MSRVGGGGVRPVRVMHVVYALRPGGMEHGVIKLVDGLVGSGVESSICSTAPADLDMRPSAGVPLFELSRRGGNDLWLVAKLVRLLKRQRPDILHTHSWGTLCEGVAAARLAGVPVVVHGEHGTLETRARNVAVQRWVWGRVERVLSVSARLADRMAASVGFPRSRIQVIVNGVDTLRFSPAGRGEARSALRLPPDAVVIGSVGRLVPVKNHMSFVDMLGRLRARGLPCVGLIAGDGPLREALAAHAAGLGLESSLRLVGHRTDIERVLAALDVFVLPSLSEGLSNTILEAMATALPVVATRVGGADELVADGVTGLLVPASDTAALASAVTRLLQDPEGRRQMGLAARHRAETHFSMARMVSGYREMYLELAGGRRRTLGDALRPERSGPAAAGSTAE